MAYKRVTVDGKTLNLRTAKMLARAEARLGLDLYVVQGSYNKGVGASAGTHDGGGAIDLSVRGLSASKITEVVRQLRKVGFAAWYRPELWRNGEKVWGPHIHAVAIGDKEMDPSARDQVEEYYAGKDGLVGDGADTGPRVHPIPVWPIPLVGVSLERAAKQFKADVPRKGVPAVKKIQRLLNYRLGTDLKVDGTAGPETRKAYKRWETKVDAARIDGVPSLGSLKQLFAGWYRVTK